MVGRKDSGIRRRKRRCDVIEAKEGELPKKKEQ